MSDMFSLGEDYRLTPFRERTGRIRGDVLSEKISFLINRWQKVVVDSEKEIAESRDTSNYRIDYRDTHASAIEAIGELESPSWQELSELTRGLDEKRLAIMHEKVKNHLVEVNDGDYYRTFAYSSGTRDALSYIVSELEKILSMTAEE
jgi:hypothetical protein